MLCSKAALFLYAFCQSGCCLNLYLSVPARIVRLSGARNHGCCCWVGCRDGDVVLPGALCAGAALAGLTGPALSPFVGLCEPWLGCKARGTVRAGRGSGGRSLQGLDEGLSFHLGTSQLCRVSRVTKRFVWWGWQNCDSESSFLSAQDHSVS